MRADLHQLILELESQSQEKDIEAIEAWIFAMDDLKVLQKSNYPIAMVEIKKHFASKEKALTNLHKIEAVNGKQMIKEYERNKQLLYCKQAKIRLEENKMELSIINLL